MNTRTDKPARSERKERTARRRRQESAETIGKRLGVNESMLDFDSFAYRWLNDAPARLHTKTVKDDWDVMHQDGQSITDSSDLGSAVSQVVGTHPDGSPLRAYLCRKPKEWFREDRDRAKKMLESQLDELRQGNDRHGVKQSDYVPNEGIRI